MERSIDHLVLATRELDALAGRYETLGFTVAPRASHNDEMGTSNRLVQLRDGAFIELLEVDRPNRLLAHDMAALPPYFSFGAHNLEVLSQREGLSMLAFKSLDAWGELEDLARAGLQTSAPFSFARRARQPDGSELEVAFRLGFVTHPDMPQVSFFLCENRYPKNFWKPDFQQHANGAQALSAIYLCAREPHLYDSFLAALTNSPAHPVDGGLLYRVDIGHGLFVFTPDYLRSIAPDATVETDRGPVLSGFRLNRFDQTQDGPMAIPAAEAGGAFIFWRDVTAGLPLKDG